MISSSWAVWMSKGVDFPGNIVEVVMLAYTVIHGCDPNKYKPGEIVEILPSDPKASPEWRMSVNKLRQEIIQKETGWRPG